MKYHPVLVCGLTPIPMKLGGGPCMLGGLTGAVSSQKVTEERNGWFSADGNRVLNVRVQASFTVSHTGQTVSKEGSSDPAIPCGRVVAQRIKGTPGITGLSLPSVHSGGAVWHLDVGSSHPGAEGGPKGCSDRREPGRSLSAVGVALLKGSFPSTRGLERTHPWCASWTARSIAG